MMTQKSFLKVFSFTVFFAVIGFALNAQSIELINENKPVSLRGLSVVTDKVVWVSGSKGTVGKSVDSGKTWWWTTVKGFESRDFRDIEAFSDKVAVIIAIAEPAQILRTTDGGESWIVVYENKTKGMFLDAMDFSGDNDGTVVGDAIGARFFIARTHDGGKTWKDEPLAFSPLADSAEGCFASSGTNIRQLNKTDYLFVSAGKQTKVFYQNSFTPVPFNESKGSTGGNSIAVQTSGTHDLWITVGGDFTKDSLRAKNCFISKDRGRTWTPPVHSPFGYRSCVEFISENSLLACGLNGVDLSKDAGYNWKSISMTSFHTCRKAKKGTAVFLSGGNGRIGKLIP